MQAANVALGAAGRAAAELGRGSLAVISRSMAVEGISAAAGAGGRLLEAAFGDDAPAAGAGTWFDAAPEPSLAAGSSASDFEPPQAKSEMLTASIATGTASERREERGQNEGWNTPLKPTRHERGQPEG
jgi:hypothetical protein